MDLSELAELAKACGMEPVDTVTQSLARISAGLYVGSGKGEEIKVIAEMFSAKSGRDRDCRSSRSSGIRMRGNLRS